MKDFTPSPNKFLDRLCKTRISGEEHQLLDVIIRKTWGYNKDEDRIALSQFEEATGGMKKPSVVRGLKKLEDKGIIIVSKLANKKGNLYRPNKNINKWKVISKKANVSNIANKSLAKVLPTINNIQKTKEINKESSEQEPVKANKPEYKQEAENFIETFNSLFSSHYRLTDDRKEKFIKRRQAYSCAEIMTALDRLSESDWHQGKDPKSKGWKADPDFLLRNDNQIDVWLNKAVKEVERPAFDNPPELMKFAKRRNGQPKN